MENDNIDLLHKSDLSLIAEKICDSMKEDRKDLISSLKGYLEKDVSDNALSVIKDNVPKIIDDYIHSNYGTIKRNVELSINGNYVKTTKDTYHRQFDRVINCVNQDVPVYLYGDSGTGKNVLAQQLAQCLKLDFYYTNCVTDEFQLKGFTSADGVYQESEFYKAFSKGGLFMLDELDASVPETLIILNAAISNKYFDFPSPIGKVEAHKDFRLVAAGNTVGRGSNEKYTGRSTIDLSSLDRFMFINIDYDYDIQKSICNDIELIEFVTGIRKSMKECDISKVISYRSLVFYEKMKPIIKNEYELLKETIFKNFNKNDFDVLCSNTDDLNQNNKYYKCLDKIHKLFDTEE